MDYVLKKMDKFGDELGIKYRLNNKCSVDKEYSDYIKSVSMDLTPYKNAPRFESLSSSKQNEFSPVRVVNRSDNKDQFNAN